MSTPVTPTEFTQLFTRAYMRMDYNTFVRSVLGAEPREGDRWQLAKFEMFQHVGINLANLAPEYIESIITFAQGATNAKN